MRRVAGVDLSQAADRYRDRLAVIDGGSRISYRELDHRSNALANRLRALGCSPGQRLVVWLPNGHEVAEAFLALEKGGYTRIPIDAGENAGFARRILEAYRPAGLVATADLLSALGRSHWPEHTVSVGGGSSAEASNFEALIESGDVSPPGIELDDRDTYQVYVRMVAAGDSLAVEHTHRNWRHEWLRNQLLYLGGWYGPRLAEDEVFLNVQQLMHGTGIMGFYPLHILGHPVVMLPQFDSRAVLAAIARHRVTTTFMVPGMLERLQSTIEDDAAGHPDRHLEIGSLRRILYGGAPISRDSLARCIDTFGSRLVQLYGRFDAAWPVTILDPEDHREMRDGLDTLWGSCGRIAPFVEAGVVDAGMRPVGAGGAGEVVVRGDGVVPAASDADGWCHTTDLAVEEPPGYLRIIGRTDDMINTGGYHVYPREIEAVLSQHAAVGSVRVIGIPDPKWGEAVTARIVLKEDYRASADLEAELVSYCRRHLSPYKVPKSLRFVDAAAVGS